MTKIEALEKIKAAREAARNTQGFEKSMIEQSEKVALRLLNIGTEEEIIMAIRSLQNQVQRTTSASAQMT